MLRPRYAAALAVLLGACQPQDTAQQQLQLYVFGTVAEVQLRDSGATDLEAVAGDLQQRFQGLHQDLHAWEPGALTAVNTAFANAQSASAPGVLIDIVARAKALEAASQGHFNPAIGGLVAAWGFHTSDYPITTPAPAPDTINHWVSKAPSTQQITVQGNVLSSSNAAVQLDLGGIAKGYAAELAMDYLIKAGLSNALVNLGGDLIAAGSPATPWTVGVHGPGGTVLGGIAIRDREAVFTSGISERYRAEPPRKPHIISPFTGQPVSGLWAVTVVAEDGVLADAAATALMVAGPEGWQRIARTLGTRQVLVVADNGAITVTKSLDQRVSWHEDHNAVRERTVID